MRAYMALDALTPRGGGGLGHQKLRFDTYRFG